jgi:23S rRNA (adenine2503-C2)-methyltransferase
LDSHLGFQDIDGGISDDTVRRLEQAGYQVIVSIGELEENAIGSNCGQYVLRHLQAQKSLQDAYSYDLQDFTG